MKDKKVVVFDLDDTLIKELHYLESAYKEIALKVDPSNASLFDKMLVLYYKGENVFKWLTEEYSTAEVFQLLDWYRNHLPTLSLVDGAKELLSYCKEQKWILGLVTDGRSVTQRNKLNAVGLTGYFDLVIISEEFGSMKPTLANFEIFNQYEGKKYYIGDNIKKDFIAPNQLGWMTICVKDDGNNIHKQDFLVEKKLLPQYTVDTIYNVLDLIK